MTLPPIDFVGLAAALLARVDVLVPQWIPWGRERAGRWYCGDWDGGEGESANVNLSTGQWIDNGGGPDDCGGDLISLYARLRNLNNGQAARELMDQLGWQRQPEPSGPKRIEHPAAPQAPAEEPSAPDDAPSPTRASRTQRWLAITPVPPHAPPATFRFGYKDRSQGDRWVEQDAVRTWEYRFGPHLYGHVARFERIDSKGELVKDTIPRTWCQDTQDERGTQKWHWKQWEAPRPLYVPATLLSADKSLPVVIVEGEKCAQAGHELLGHEFDFVSWPGGCKAWAMADWSWLAGRTVYLWPDCDAQHQRLTKAEKAEGVDPKSKPLLPELQQPGMQAMRHIATTLVADHGCVAHLVRIPKPGAVSDGWDIADAIAQGWDAAQVRDQIRAASVFQPDPPEPRAKAAGQTPALAAAEDAGEDITWRRFLLMTAKGSIVACRENVVLALDGTVTATGRHVPGAPECQGLIAFNEFTNDVVLLKDAPWGSKAGTWGETDELELGDWLTRVYYLPSMSRQTLEEAVSLVARRHRYHPARERFEALRGTWDNTQRLRTWLMRCCRAEGLPQDGEDASDADARLHELATGDPLGQYLARVGRWICMAIVARVLQPGVKFDYMLILEGGQGLGKSTLARTLGGPWFADTGLVLGDKDSYQNLQGVLVYEWGELDSLTRAEVTKVKQFVSSASDRFRASFDRRARDYPRQVVFVGTTNESHYLSDPTGNRRFWPLRVTRQIDLAWLRANLDQLFAEALHYVDAGQRMHPSPAEQEVLFSPQQSERTVENALESAIRVYLYDEEQRVPPNGRKGSLIDEITLADLLTTLGISVDKQTQVLTKQASAALGRLGWERARASGKGGGARPWVYRRPDADPPHIGPVAEPAAGQSINRATSGPQPAGDADACPF